jgi:hypothetical protein
MTIAELSKFSSYGKLRIIEKFWFLEFSLGSFSIAELIFPSICDKLTYENGYITSRQFSDWNLLGLSGSSCQNKYRW